MVSDHRFYYYTKKKVCDNQELSILVTSSHLSPIPFIVTFMKGASMLPVLYHDVEIKQKMGYAM